jgi:TPR repeat protein
MSDIDERVPQLAMRAPDMKRIARYELTFDKFAPNSSVDDLAFPDDFTYTLDDLKQALINLRRVNPTLGEFRNNWYYPIMNNEEDSFEVSYILWSEDDDTAPDYLKEYAGALPVTDRRLFRNIWWELECWYDDDEDENIKLCDAVDLDELLGYLARYERNKGKPIEEWEFTKEEKENYVRFFESDRLVKTATENQLALCRKYIDELCSEDSEIAMHIKAYSCYGGNRLYPCDWNTSRDYVTKLFDKTDNPQYANTLGYIYYYGRCNGGEPEYDKAFYYFGIAAANGLYEGVYKLADMFRHGYGCKKSKQTAFNLYWRVYDDTYKRFLNEEDTSFADAALRMGNVYAKGIGEAIIPVRAYYYYLQADYAIKLRMDNYDGYGDATVAAGIRKALDETVPELPEDYFREKMEFTDPYYFELLASDGNCCRLTRKEDAEGNIVLTSERIETRGNRNPDYVLVTEPRLQYCERRKDISYVLESGSGVRFKDDVCSVRYNYSELNYNNEYDFYYDDRLVACVKCDNYRLLIGKEPVPDGEQICLAGVRFGEGGRIYDYICEIEDVKIGDTVIVETNTGETEVKVVRVETKSESELSLPAERYKKIIRKA